MPNLRSLYLFDVDDAKIFDLLATKVTGLKIFYCIVRHVKEDGIIGLVIVF